MPSVSCFDMMGLYQGEGGIRMREKERVQKQFGKNANHYVTSKSHAKGQDLAKLVDIVQKHGASGNLLDIATGGGHVANALAPYFKEVTAFDLTQDMLIVAEKFISANGHDNVIFVQGDAENTPFPDMSFEVVTCRIAAHHFPAVDRFIREVYRVLKPGGLFVLGDNAAPENNEYDEFYNTVEKKRDPSHYRAYKKSEWINKVETAGLYLDSLHTFKKKFNYETWCSMMDLAPLEKTDLTTYMISASSSLRSYFSIEMSDKDIVSFEGQSILLAARKNQG
jgi:ubiquinone/menaquinone biosynthesis C-methylase UbiE